MARTKKPVKLNPAVEAATEEVEEILYDFGDDLPKTIEVQADELRKLEGHAHTLMGRYWKDGKEIVCVRLHSKHT